MTSVTSGAAAHGLLAEFPSPAALLDAARAAHGAGYRRLEAYSPMLIEGLVEALGPADRRLPRLALIGGIIGGVGTYALQWFSVSVDYPLNIGGRTPAWPGLIPGTFEMTVLGAVLAIFFGVLLRSRLPRLYHPVFNDAGFAAASSDGFFLCIEATDPLYDLPQTRDFLERLQPVRVSQVDA
jgi:ActD protein